MEYTEINRAGDFEFWDPSKVKELQEDRISNCLGQKLLFENENVLVWEIALFPGERLPFRHVTRDFNWVCLTEGLVISRCGDGEINLIRMKKGDTGFISFKGEVSVQDFENIGDDGLLMHVMEFKPFSIMAPFIHKESFL